MEVELDGGLQALWRPTRRTACARLANEGTAAACAHLVAAVTYYSDPLHPDPRTVAAALEGLRRQTDPAARRGFVAAWHTSKRPAPVSEVLRELGWVQEVTGPARVFLACLLGLPQHLADLSPEELPAWREACADPTLAETAWEALARFQDPEVREVLCREALAEPTGPLAAGVRKAGFLPATLSGRLEFWLLLGQADRVWEVDPEGQETVRIYTAADGVARARMRAAMQVSGDLRWQQVLRPHFRPEQLLPDEVEVLVALARKHGTWADLWALVPRVGLRQAVRLLEALDAASWTPLDPAEREAFREVWTLARAVAGTRWTFTTRNGHGDRVRALAVTPDGRLLASGGEDGTLRLWDLPSGRELATLAGHRGAVTRLVVSPEGGILASAGWDGTVRLWALPEGKPLATLEVPGSGVTELAITPDGRRLCAGSPDDTVHLWELPSGRSLGMLADFTHRTHWARPVMALAPTPDGRMLAAGMDDGSLRLWGLLEGRSLVRLTRHPRSVRALAITPDGHLLASGSDDGTVRLWALPEGKPLATLQSHQSGVRALAVSPDGQLLASGGADRSVRLWRLPEGLLQTTLTGPSTGIARLTVSPDGEVLVAVDRDAGVRAWNLPTGDTLGAWSASEGDAAVTVTADGRILAAGGREGSVRIAAFLHGHDLGRWGPDRILPRDSAGGPLEALAQWLLRYRFRHAVVLGSRSVEVPGPTAVVLHSTRVGPPDASESPPGDPAADPA